MSEPKDTTGYTARDYHLAHIIRDEIDRASGGRNFRMTDPVEISVGVAGRPRINCLPLAAKIRKEMEALVTTKDTIDLIIRDAAEIERNPLPYQHPDEMRVTEDELRAILEERLQKMPNDQTQTTTEAEKALKDAHFYGCGFLMVHPDGRLERLPTKAVSLDMAMIKAMPDEDTTIRPSADTGFWLYEYQKALTNVRGAINRGQSETATAMIDELISRWQLGCQMKQADIAGEDAIDGE